MDRIHVVTTAENANRFYDLLHSEWERTYQRADARIFDAPARGLVLAAPFQVADALMPRETHTCSQHRALWDRLARPCSAVISSR